MEIYYTNYNYNNTYKVTIQNNDVNIYSFIDNDEDKEEYSEMPTYEFKNVEHIFIGKSPICNITLYYEVYGPEFDGNTILLHIKNNEYVYIGNDVYKFKSISKIITYNSPVGRNYVPNPYAVDKNNNVYILGQEVIMTNYNFKKNIIYKNALADYYYDIHYITHQHKKIYNPLNIKYFYVDGDKYNLNYCVNPGEYYDKLADFINGYKGIIKIVYNDNKEKILNRQDYIDIITKFGKMKGFVPIDVIQF